MKKSTKDILILVVLGIIGANAISLIKTGKLPYQAISSLLSKNKRIAYLRSAAAAAFESGDQVKYVQYQSELQSLL